ncbi:UNVERIFIED_CONTAM: hypothetical protein HDU68_008262 [Siphonaria sp. JEL0065]|nr:hypothetical protein HDU68_008262 [Siphonaria sp. JEL0065]
MFNAIRRNANANANANKRTVFSLARPSPPRPSVLANDPFFDNFDQIEKRLNSLFADFGRSNRSALDSNWSSFVKAPRLDVKETDKSYFVMADLPGISKDEINVSVKDNVLTISGEHKTSTEEKNEVRHVIERASGSFSRSISLPADASANEIKASMADGVLKLEIGKVEVKPDEGIKKITIE